MKAIDVPELSHLFNVVVFSSDGQRPDQHKLSNGDLDGDIYSIMWDHKIVDAFWGICQPSQNKKQEGTQIST